MPLKRGTGDLRHVHSPGAIHFPMEDTKTGKRIICQVSIYTLKELSGLDGHRAHPGSYPGHMQTFLYFQERIENG